MLIFWQKQVWSEQKFNMYHTDHHEKDSHCILYYARHNYITWEPQETQILFAHQIIPYCLRPSEESVLILGFNNTNDLRVTFKELRDKNISSEELLSWSVSIDLAESYQIFLTNNSQWLSPTKELLVYNCTLPWFGPLCQFAFDPLTNKSLDEIVAFNFASKPSIRQGSKVTCYEHLRCKTSLICLDWRDICDRRVDCLDGSDEFNCWQLEINECAENEYRCHNGQCIPEEFFQDVETDPDCLDRTDEPRELHTSNCDRDPAFRCEEQTCYPGRTNDFPCGDGTCVVDKSKSCLNGRNNPLFNDNCSIAMACIVSLRIPLDEDWCKQFCSNNDCVKEYCPTLHEFSYGPVILGHVRFIFDITKIEIKSGRIPLPKYVCYNEMICAEFLQAKIYLNHSTCRYLDELELKGLPSVHESLSFSRFMNTIKDRFRGCLILPNDVYHCNYSTMYQCKNSSKCISKHRLVDGIEDCPLADDETFDYSCSLSDARFRRTCTIDKGKICIAPSFILDSQSRCEEERESDIRNGIDKYDDHIYFQRLCDGKPDLMTISIDGQTETDETNCESWPCNNTYTRCDGFWSCKDGADEINCPNSKCPEFHHSCVFPDDPSKLSCLPMSRAGNGIIDCLGASDEREECRSSFLTAVLFFWQCFNTTACRHPELLCNFDKGCKFGDDELFCDYKSNINYLTCTSPNLIFQSDIVRFFCSFLFSGFGRSSIIAFKISNMLTYPLHISTDIVSLSPSTQLKTQLIQNKQISRSINTNLWRCNRGLPIYIRTNNDMNKLHCLCPPSYYGDACQYQNQRVSLTLQIRATSDWLKLFIILIVLVDHEENIESHDYIEYLPARDCKMKFNVYLLYSTRSKNSSKNYSIRIHAFNKFTLKYRVSWIFPVQFSFLPVHRMAVLLVVPFLDIQSQLQCTPECVHGRCWNNFNNLSSTFCQCDPGWSGIQCNIEYTCNCAFGSLCFADTICICPAGRFGRRCHLLQSSCSSEICANGGQCLSMDQRYIQDNLSKTTCICPELYSGDHCEHRQTQINLSFHSQISTPAFIVIHFITVRKGEEHIRSSIMKKLPVGQNSLSFYAQIKFHIAIIESLSNYYLIILQEEDILSANISTEVIPSHRCISIHELLDEIHSKQHQLKRMKFYHILCQQKLNLVCFFDDIHFCLCDLGRQANCFEFDHNTTYDCYGYNYCENGGRCFRDDSDCPKSSTCSCRDCYFGSKCQFSTQGSTLSLDVILGYYINPNVQFNQQSFTIKMTVVLIAIIICFGFTGNLLSFFTFRMKTTRNVGSGLYLFTSSIISILAMFILMIKFGLLFASQIGAINHRLILHLQCVSVDFLVRFVLSTIDWLSACVAIERVVNVLKGIHFDKEKSKQFAKRVIPIVFIFTSLTHIHDPIHRHLVDDEEEQRTWCIVTYSASLQILEWLVNIVHFSVPCGINCISALIIIIFTARIRVTAQENQSYKQLLYKQCWQHKHLLISPFILIVLSLPRLIISLLSGCMKSARNPWLYLIGYFISFIPPMLTFVIFVLPSKMYITEFKKSIRRFW
ncbi:unnamed protein product [Adineta steineri]|uniref:Uncharacterized protein n=2 Tax=Adineta steineri TaxID=433720 RepID=A0A818ZDW3_9BILA|nr:unnamed protein product [Adineta steineri]